MSEMENHNLLQNNQLSEKSSELAKLDCDLRAAREEVSQKNKENTELVLKLEQIQGHTEELEQTIATLEAEFSQLKSTYQENIKQLDEVQNQLTNITNAIKILEERVTELEPLSEAVEQEKLRRIKETAEWGEHEQLLRGEKDSLATLSTHLQQQLDEQKTEHRIHLQRLKNESEGLLKDKNQLIEQLNAAKEGRAMENSAWIEKQTKLEEEIKTLKGNLSEAEDLSATRYQRCEKLQTSAEKYHTLKIGENKGHLTQH